MVVVLAFFIELNNVSVDHCGVYVSVSESHLNFDQALGFVVEACSVIVS